LIFDDFSDSLPPLRSLPAGLLRLLINCLIGPHVS
jgi:hypothetical protein